MSLNDFDYELPKERIAQKSAEPRDSAKLLVARRKENSIENKKFSDIVSLMSPGDILVLNDTRVVPARIFGHKIGTGGKVEALMVEMHSDGIWKALLKPTIKEGQEVEFTKDLKGKFAGRDPEGYCLLDFGPGAEVKEFLKKEGHIPLPPYIKREDEAVDHETYQTVFAKTEGAIAAPTAGLHFTKELLKKVEDAGVKILYVTLHVGYGTFKPVEDLENHRMHSEWFEVSEEVAREINEARTSKRAVWACGTTALRALETCVKKGKIIAGRGQTDLYITPGFKFEAVDRLITNFHLPKTTLLLLVGAFMGSEFLRKSYEHALKNDYRFYSYGDAMVII